MLPVTLKPSSLRSVIGPMVSPLMVRTTAPAGISILVVMMMKSCLPRFVVRGDMRSLNAKEEAGARHQLLVLHSLSEGAP